MGVEAAESGHDNVDMSGAYGGGDGYKGEVVVVFDLLKPGEYRLLHYAGSDLRSRVEVNLSPRRAIRLAAALCRAAEAELGECEAC